MYAEQFNAMRRLGWPVTLTAKSGASIAPETYAEVVAFVLAQGKEEFVMLSVPVEHYDDGYQSEAYGKEGYPIGMHYKGRAEVEWREADCFVLTKEEVASLPVAERMEVVERLTYYYANGSDAADIAEGRYEFHGMEGVPEETPGDE